MRHKSYMKILTSQNLTILIKTSIRCWRWVKDSKDQVKILDQYEISVYQAQNFVLTKKTYLHWIVNRWNWIWQKNKSWFCKYWIYQVENNGWNKKIMFEKYTCTKPFFEIIYFRINSWISCFATSTSVRNHSNQNCFVINRANQRSTWITLTSIFTRSSNIIIFRIQFLSWIMWKSSTKLIVV